MMAVQPLMDDLNGPKNMRIDKAEPFKYTHTCYICNAVFDREVFPVVSPNYICRSCYSFVNAFMVFFNWRDVKMAVTLVKVLRNGTARVSISYPTKFGPDEIDIILKTFS